MSILTGKPTFSGSYMIAGILLGIVTGLATAYRTILPLIRKDGGHEPKGRSFNDHI